MPERVLAVIPLPQPIDHVVEVLQALTARFPNAVARDGAHSGTYIPNGAGQLPARTMEVLLPDEVAERGPRKRRRRV